MSPCSFSGISKMCRWPFFSASEKSCGKTILPVMLWTAEPSVLQGFSPMSAAGDLLFKGSVAYWHGPPTSRSCRCCLLSYLTLRLWYFSWVVPWMHRTFPRSPSIYQIAILESSSCKSCRCILEIVGLVGQIGTIIRTKNTEMVSDVNQQYR